MELLTRGTAGAPERARARGGSAGGDRLRARVRAGAAAGALLGALAPCAVGATPARRLAVLAPAAAETLAALGATDRVVAVGDFVTSPPELARLPKLGSYDAPSAERLLALGVDALVTTAGVAGRGDREALRRLGIRVVELDTERYGSALAAIGTVGELVGRGSEAKRIVAAIESRLAALEAATRGLPRRSALVVVGREPLFVAAGGSFLDRLIRAGGGANVAGDLATPFAQVSLEAILERRPEVIVDTADNRAGALRGAVLGSWGRYGFLPAVRDRRVYFVDPEEVTIPGPRMGEIAERLARMIHPGLFGRPRPDDFAPAAGGASP